MAQAGIVGQATDLAMVNAGWVATVSAYLNLVPKARIPEAVREAKGDAEVVKGDAEVVDSISEADLPAFLTNGLPVEGVSTLAAE